MMTDKFTSIITSINNINSSAKSVNSSIENILKIIVYQNRAIKYIIIGCFAQTAVIAVLIYEVFLKR